MTSVGAELGRKVRLGAPIVAVVLVLGLVGAMAITPTRDLLRQRARIAAMSADLHHTRTSNSLLRKRIVRLQDPDYVEQQAREQIGLVRPGETTYVVMPPSKKAQRSHRHHHHKATTERRTKHRPHDGFVAGLLDFIGFG